VTLSPILSGHPVSPQTLALCYRAASATFPLSPPCSPHSSPLSSSTDRSRPWIRSAQQPAPGRSRQTLQRRRRRRCVRREQSKTIGRTGPGPVLHPPVIQRLHYFASVLTTCRIPASRCLRIQRRCVRILSLVDVVAVRIAPRLAPPFSHRILAAAVCLHSRLRRPRAASDDPAAAVCVSAAALSFGWCVCWPQRLSTGVYSAGGRYFHNWRAASQTSRSLGGCRRASCSSSLQTRCSCYARRP
jgi:hypothetical protein